MNGLRLGCGSETNPTKRLIDASENVKNYVLPNLEKYEGRWHTLGFMVFMLASNQNDRLKLHVWPKFTRQKTEYGPMIHDHAQDITSLVIAGEYTDNIYNVEQFNSAEQTDNKQLKIFQPNDNKRGQLTFKGSFAIASLNEERTIPQGAIHEISVGQFHVPTIEENKFAATLMISSLRSRRSGPRINVLIDTDLDSIEGRPCPVTAEQAASVKDYL